MTPHTEKEYFWKDFEQVYQDEWVGKRLLAGEEVSLETLKSGYILSPKNIDNATNMTQEERFDFFLNFLLGVLKDKELKVSMSDLQYPMVDRTIRLGEPYKLEGTPEEQIMKIKSKWYEAKSVIDEADGRDFTDTFESNCVNFILPENEWNNPKLND